MQAVYTNIMNGLRATVACIAIARLCIDPEKRFGATEDDALGRSDDLYILRILLPK